MKTHPFLAELCRRYPAAIANHIVFALNSNSIIWQSVAASNIGFLALEVNRSDPPDLSSWSPASLAMQGLLAREPAINLDEAASDCLHSWQADGEFQPFSLETACLIALALSKTTTETEGLATLFTKKDAQANEVSAILSCLLSLAPDLSALFDLAFRQNPAIAAHALAAIPVDDRQEKELLLHAFRLLQGADQINALMAIAAQRQGLAAWLAQAAPFEPTIPETTLPTNDSVTKEMAGLIQRISYIEHLSQAYLDADVAEPAAKILSLALQDVLDLQAHLTARLAAAYSRMPLEPDELSRVEDTADQDQSPVAINGNRAKARLAWSEALRLSPANLTLHTSIAMTMLAAGEIELAESALNLGDRNEEDGSSRESRPDYWVARALIANGQSDFDMANKFVNMASGLAEKSRMPLSSVDKLASMALSFKLYSLAGELADRHLILKRNDPTSLDILSKSLQATGRLSEALDATQLAYLLSPTIARHRALIAMLEANSMWSASLDEYQRLFSNLTEPPADVWLQYAICALRAGEGEKTEFACQKLLTANPNDGLAKDLFGQLLWSKDEYQEAMVILQQAVQFAPDKPGPWISLAHAWEISGHPAKAEETLRLGCQASSTTSWVHLALGKILLAEDSPNKALTPLRQAYVLAVDGMHQAIDCTSMQQPWPNLLRQEIGLNLGNTYFELGYFDQASVVFADICENAARPDEISPDLQHGYAKSLFALGQPDQSLVWFEQVLKQQPDNPWAALNACKAYLRSAQQPAATQKAIIILQRLSATGDDMRQAAEHYKVGERPSEEALALLAESYAFTGQLEQAQRTYCQALNTDLYTVPAWRSRLSFGLGKVANSLDQPETALAALLETSQIDPHNPLVYQLLADVYKKLDLITDAFQAARAAAELDSENLSSLLWYSDFCINLSDHPASRSLPLLDEAIAALQKACKIAPEQASLYVKLAQIHQLAGMPELAYADLGIFTQTNSPELIVSTSDFYQAARVMDDLEQFPAGAEFLNRAIQLIAYSEIQNAATEGPDVAILFAELSELQRKSAEFEISLLAIDRAVTLKPNYAPFLDQRATVLLESSRLEEAIASLRLAYEIEPDFQNLKLKLAVLCLAAGKLSNGRAYAMEAFNSSNWPGVELSTMTTWIAATCASLSLDPAGALQIIADQQFDHESQHSPEATLLSKNFAFLSSGLQADIELVNGNQSGAAVAIGTMLEMGPYHARTLAAQGRLLARQEGPTRAALSLVRTGLDSWKNTLAPEYSIGLPKALGKKYQEIFSRLVMNSMAASLSEAALELSEWRHAREIIHSLSQSEQPNPANQLLQIKLYVRQAEYQRLAQFARAVQHSPGEDCLSTAAQAAIQQLVHEFHNLPNLEQGISKVALDNWRMRGELIFEPSVANLEAFQLLLEPVSGETATGDLAALVWGQGQAGLLEAALQNAQIQPKSLLVQVQLAIGFSSTFPERALTILQSSLEQTQRLDLEFPDAIPMCQAIIAQIASELPLRSSIRQLALDSIMAGLAEWPDEPRWHALTAEIILRDPAGANSEDINQAISHLELASQLEPKESLHLMSLGQAYLLADDPSRALAALEQAVTITPDLAEGWYALAQLQMILGNYDKAVVCVERAIDLAPSPIEALLLRTELSLLTNNPRSAQTRAQSVLNINPDNPTALFMLARSLEALQQPVEALTAVERGIPLAEDPIEMHMLRARLIYRIQGPESASQALMLLEEQYPNNPELLAMQANYSMKLGELDRATQSASLALQLGGQTLPDDQQAELHMLLGSLAHQGGQLDLALHHIHHAVEKSPGQIDYYLELGRVLQDRRQSEKAMDVYRQAALISPLDYRPYYQAGIALKEGKDYLEAENMFRRAAHLAPSEVAVHRQLAAVVALNLVHNRRLAAVQ